MAAGVAAWFSLGVLALVAPEGHLRVVGLLPPRWVLGLLLVASGIASVSFARPPSGLLILTSLTILPWFGPIWPAALIWTAPFVLLIWLVVLASTLDMARWSSWFDRSARCFPGLAAAICFTGFAWAVWPSGISGDEPHYLLMTTSALNDGDVDLANDYGLTRHQTFYPGALEPRHVVLTASGKEYSFHGPGVAFLVLPGFAAAGLLGARIILILVSALGILALWTAACRLVGSRAAWAAVAALIFQLPFTAQSSALYPDGPAAAITSFALLTMIRLEDGDTPSTGWLASAGAALAMLPWFHIRFSLLATVFGLALLIALWRRTRRVLPIATVFSIPLLSAIALFASSWLMFETLDPTAPFRQKASGSLAAAPVGTLGLVADHEYGLLPYAPAMAFAVAGFFQLRRRVPLTAWSSLIAAAGAALTAASFVWWGGTSAPARFLVPVLPVLAIWIAAWWSTALQSTRAGCGVLILIGGVLLALAGWADRGFYVITNPDARYSIFEWMNAVVNVPDSLPSLFRPSLDIREELLIAFLWAVTGLMTLWFVGRAMPAREAIGTDLTLLASATVVWVCLGATLGWAVRGTAAVTPDRSQLALLQASARPWLPTGFVHGEFSESREDVLANLAFEAPPDRDPRTLLHAPRVPAGRYRIEVSGASRLSASGATFTLEIGRDSWPLWTWPVDTPHEAPSFTLAMPVHSVRVVTSVPIGDGMRVRLKPLRSGPLPATGERADRVTRYGDLLVYSLDRTGWIETGGFWLPGDQRSRLVIAGTDGSNPSLDLALEAGPVSVALVVRRGEWSGQISLEPSAQTRIVVPATGQPTVTEIDVRGGDRRRPAVWLTVQPTHFPDRSP